MTVGMLAIAIGFAVLTVLKIPVFGTLFQADSSLVEAKVEPSLLVKEDALCLGPSSAPYKLVMFGDYECPPCHQAWFSLKALVREKPGKLAVYFRNFPLTSIHPNALEAASIAEMAKATGTFAKVHDGFYTVALLNRTTTQTVRSQLGPQARSDELYFKAKKTVAADLNLGMQLGVDGTPTMYLIKPGGTAYRLKSFAALPRLIE